MIRFRGGLRQILWDKTDSAFAGGMEAAKGQRRFRWAGKVVAVICQRQPSGNNPKNIAAKWEMSDYIMSVTGGAAATEPRAAGNAMLCKNDQSELTKQLERDGKKNNPLGNRINGPPDMAKEIGQKLLRARLLPGKDNAIQRLTDCMGRDGGLARGVIKSVTQGTTPQ